MTDITLGGTSQNQEILDIIQELAALSLRTMDMNDQAKQTLALLGRTLKADRGAFFEVREEKSRIKEIATWAPTSQRKILFNKDRVQRFKQFREPVLWKDGETTSSPERNRVPSHAEARSIMAAPFEGRHSPNGLLYFESTSPNQFEESQLKVVAIAANLASLAAKTFKGENRPSSSQHNKRDHGILGKSKSIIELRGFIDKVARVDSTVLLFGESGTGKELVAQAIHLGSARSSRPIIAINCATLSENLLESELFGHERGAFTGATRRRIGKMEAAHGGTLFLDEVGEIPSPLQAKLLRVLQERTFERVGSNEPIKVDTRIVAATNRDLAAAVHNGTFREDLFHRLDVVSTRIPSLRERSGDIELLARHFLRFHRGRLGRPLLAFHSSALRHLRSYPWPGNVRQLSNAVERAVVLSDEVWIRAEHLSSMFSWPKLPDEKPSRSSTFLGLDASKDYQTTITETKKKLITEALKTAEGNAAEAARRLGLHPNSFRRLRRQLGLK